MELLNTSAFVFQAVPFSENDKRVVLLTRDFGRVTAIAPYAQRSKRRFGGALEPLTEISALYTQKQKSALARLSEISVMNSFSILKKDVKKMAYGCYFLEIIAEVMREGESEKVLFNFLHAFLETLEKTKQEEVLARLFEARILPHIGYEPILRYCSKCRRDIQFLSEKILFSYKEGGIKCSDCAQDAQQDVIISKGALFFISEMISKKESQKLNIGQALQFQQEVKMILPSFLFHHLGREMNSYRFIQALIAE